MAKAAKGNGRATDSTKEYSISADFPRQLLEETPDAIIAITPNGKVLHWNRAAEGSASVKRVQTESERT
jgi:PAS domain-containing protein